MSIQYAFPVPQDFCDLGMTLRDYFAAKAMQAMLASSEADDFRPSKWGELTLPEIAEESYRMGGLMLRAREVAE